MPDNFQNVIRAIPKQPQRQDGTNEQLRDLIPFAIRLGLYDAADLMKSMVARTDTAIKAAS